MADNEFKIRMMKTVQGLINEIKARNTDPYHYVSELYSAEVYLASLFGQEMERHMMNMRMEKKKSEDI